MASSVRITSRNLTVVLNDIVGSTSMIAHRSRQALMDLLQTFDALMRPVIHHYGGRIVKTIGDAYLTVFEIPTDAVLCAIRMQYVLRGYNKARAEADQIHVRVAINSGEMQIAGDGDVFGEAVNLVARLAGVTEADQIYLTEQVYLIMNRNEVPDTLAVKKFSFKGIVGEVTVYRVVQNDDNAVYARIVADQLRATDEQSTLAKPLTAGWQKAKALWDGGRWWLVGGAAALVVLIVMLTRPERPPPSSASAPAVPLRASATKRVAPSPTPAAAAKATSAAAQAAATTSAPPPRIASTFGLTVAKPTAEEMVELVEHLGSEDDNEVRMAATRLVRARVVDERALVAAAEKLQRSCTERPGNDMHADAMGWLCNVIGQSTGTAYVPVLEEVAAKTIHSKVKRYALTNIQDILRHAQNERISPPAP